MPTISGGGAQFNGGTITKTLTVHPPSGQEGVVVAGTDGNTTKLLDLSAVHTVFTVDSDGTVTYTSDDQALFHIEGTGGTQSIVNFDDDSNRYRFHFDSTASGGIELFYAGAEVFRAWANTNTSRGMYLRHPDNPATVTLSSGTGAQIDTNSDRETYTPVTFNAAAADATCAVAISPDNTTYTPLGTITHKSGLANGEIELIPVYVPGGWYLRLTAVNATIGTTTFF